LTTRSSSNYIHWATESCYILFECRSASASLIL